MNLFKIILVCIIILLFAVGYSFVDEYKKVSYFKIEQNNKEIKIFHGVVKAYQTSNLSFQSEGKIVYLPYIKGEYVKKGQVLARLDGALYKIKKDEEKQLLNEYKIQYDKQKKYYARMNVLHSEGAVSDNDWESAYYGMKTTKQKIEIQREKIKYLDKQIDYNIIVSPFDGYIGDRIKNVGEFVHVGDSVVSVIQIGCLQVEFVVDEKLLDKIKLSNVLKAKILDKYYNVSVSNISKTSYIDGGYLIKAVFEDKDIDIKEGMSAYIELALENKNSNIKIPVDCVLDEKSNKYVYKIENLKNNVGQLIKTKVIVGNIYDDKIEILSGISFGDLIIDDCIYDLKDRQKIRI